MIYRLLEHGDTGAWGAVVWCGTGLILWLANRKANNRWNRR
jgi:hypothetical protein